MSFAAPAGKRRGLRDWTELIFKDHGFFRVWWHNLHEIAPVSYTHLTLPTRIFV